MPKVEVENAFEPPWSNYKMFSLIAPSDGHKYITGYHRTKKYTEGKRKGQPIQLRRYEYVGKEFTEDEIPNSIAEIEKITSYKDNPKLWMKLYMRGSRRGGLDKNKGTKTNQNKRFPDSKSGKTKKRVVREKEIKESKKVEEEKRDEDKDKREAQKVIKKVIEKVSDDAEKKKKEKEDEAKKKKEDEMGKKKEVKEKEKPSVVDEDETDPEKLAKVKGGKGLTPEQKTILKSFRAKAGLSTKEKTKKLTKEAEDSPEYQKWEKDTNTKVKEVVNNYNNSLDKSEGIRGNINRQKKAIDLQNKKIDSGDYRNKASYYKGLKEEQEDVKKYEDKVKKMLENLKNQYSKIIKQNKRWISDPDNIRRAEKEEKDKFRERSYDGSYSMTIRDSKKELENAEFNLNILNKNPAEYSDKSKNVKGDKGYNDYKGSRYLGDLRSGWHSDKSYLKGRKDDLAKAEKRIKDKDWRQNKKDEVKKKDDMEIRYNKLIDEYNKNLPSFNKSKEEMKKYESFVFGTKMPKRHKGKVDNKVSKQNPFAYKKEEMSEYDKKRKHLFKIKFRDFGSKLDKI